MELDDPVMRLTLHLSHLLQVAQVGDGLTRGEPLLNDGEMIPGRGPDVPGHQRGDIMGAQGRAVQDIHHLVKPALMMILKLSDAASVVAEQPAVAGQYQVDIQFNHLFQALKIAVQWVAVIRPALNVGGDVDEKMVPRNQDSLFRFVQAGMSQGMTGSLDAGKGIFAVLDLLPIGNDLELGVPLAPELAGRMGGQSRTQSVYGKPVSAGIVEHPLQTVPGLHNFHVRPVEPYPGGRRGQFGNQAVMIGMQVGNVFVAQAVNTINQF